MSLNIIFQGWHCKHCLMLASDSPPNLDKVQSIPVTGRFGEAGDWKLGIFGIVEDMWGKGFLVSFIIVTQIPHCWASGPADGVRPGQEAFS